MEFRSVLHRRSGIGAGAPEALRWPSRQKGETTVDFEYSDKVKALQERLTRFMDDHVYPNEHRYHEGVTTETRWQPRGIVEEL
jgi:hypothetical protein